LGQVKVSAVLNSITAFQITGGSRFAASSKAPLI
jgi:hypothetical protein